MCVRLSVLVCVCECVRASLEVSARFLQNFKFRRREMTLSCVIQTIPLGVTFSNTVSKLKAQSSNVSFHRNVAKETCEL